MTAIADAGLLIAFLNRNDAAHAWAVQAMQAHAPFLVCEAVLTEAAAVTGKPAAILRLVLRGDLRPQFELTPQNVARLVELLDKYADQPMDLGDACVVRMSELEPAATVFTVDRDDFAVYRRARRQPVPCAFPPTER